MSTEGVLIARSNVPRQDSLVLVLRQLVVVIWNLNPISRCEQVEVKNILAGGLKIKPVEDSLAVADVVKRSEFRRIQKPSTTRSIKRNEVPELCISKAKGNTAASGAEGSIICVDVSEGTPSPKARTGRNL